MIEAPEPDIFVTLADGQHYRVRIADSNLPWQPSRGYKEDYLLKEIVSRVDHLDPRNPPLYVDGGRIVAYRSVCTVYHLA